MSMRRPALNRGHSLPTYPNTLSSFSTDSTLSSLASLSLSDPRNNSAGDLVRRGVSASEGSTPAALPSPPVSSANSSPYGPSMSRSRSHTSSPAYSQSQNLPAVTSPPANVSSVLLRSRSTPPQSNVNLKIDSTPHEYVLLAPLGGGFSAESITIAARKGNVIVVVADRWDQEQDCHYEWQVQFDKDADMSSVHARFENGLLRVTVRRFSYGR